MESKVSDIILGMLKELKSDVNSRLDKIESKLDNVVTKEQCKENSCITPGNLQFLEKKEEWTVKKITAYGAILTAMLGGIAGIVKLIFDSVQ